MPSYESLVRDHHALVFRIALGILRDRAAAEDVAQDVFLEFLLHPEAVERAANARAFVGRAAVNRALNARRGQARRAKHELAAGQGGTTMDPIEEVFRREVRSKVAELPDEERLAVDLHYFQGFTLAETAAALDIAHRTVSSRLGEALTRLRKALGAAAFVALLAGLESELSHCGAEEIPGGLTDRLLRLRSRAVPAGRTAGRRFSAAAVSMGIALLLAFFGAKGFQTWRDGQPSGVAAALAETPAATPVAAPSEEAGSSSPAVAAIDRDRDLHGIVVTESGSPVKGALLSTVTHPWQRANVLALEQRDEEVPGAGTRSAADGSFAIRLRRGDIVTLRVSAEGFAAYEIPQCQAGERLRVVVRPGVRVVARALDEQGQPVSGVRLRLLESEDRLDVQFDLKGVTGPEGTFVFEGVPPLCKAWLSAEHDGLGDPGWIPVRTPATDEIRLDVVMLRGRALTGCVTDSATGKPIPGARVGMGWTMDLPVVADAEGRYRMPRWTDNGAVDLTADAEGYAEESIQVGSSAVVDFALTPGDVVAGRLVTPAGVPVPGARVSVVASEQRESGQVCVHRNGLSDAAGRFRLAGLRRDMPHSLVAIADGFGRFLLDFNPHPDSAGTVELGDLVLPEARTLEGRILDAAGLPAPRIAVTLAGHNADRGRLRPGGDPLHGFYGCTESAASDDLGRFRFRDLAAGNYVLKIRQEGAPDLSTPVVIPAGSDVTGVELRLSDEGSIRILVLDERGDPVEGAVVHANDGTRNARTTTGPDGRAVLRFAGSSVTVQVYAAEVEGHPRLLTTSQVATAETRDLQFVLAEAGTASGLVVGVDGKPVAGASLEIHVGGIPAGRLSSDGGGRFNARFPLPGPIDIVLVGVGPHATFAPENPTILEGRLDRVVDGSKDLRLVARPVPSDRSLTVRLEAPDGTPAAGATVLIFCRNSVLKFEDSDAQGLVRFSGLPATTLEIESFANNNPEWIGVTASVLPEGQEHIARFREGAWMDGIVVGPGGKSVPGARVVATIDGREFYAALSGEDGRFKVRIDPAESRPVDLTVAKHSGGGLGGSLKGIRPGSGPVTLSLTR